MAKMKTPVVDEADVDRIVDDFIRNNADFTVVTPDERADLAYQYALDESRLLNHSREWGKELARKVRQRMMWAKPSD